ncbi:hypothetical protein B5M09_010999 [Aphanomyces astaci]|uniref:beta-glucosidase n=1 Tax=Aphanomyces astaci TaxID=112090 RepID=A0A3R7X7M7_APHAT|nr:hypothetical protein B5M09_010999 [Aphanomyces astaci]
MYTPIGPAASQPRGMASLLHWKAYFVVVFVALGVLFTASSIHTGQSATSVSVALPVANMQTLPSLASSSSSIAPVSSEVDPTLAQKVGQMLQVDISTVLYGKNRNPRFALNKARVAYYAKLGIGSYFNSPFAGGPSRHESWTADEWHDVIDQIQAIYAQHNAVPAIYGIDTIHGANYVRDAVLFPQPLAAASSFNLDVAYRMGEVSAKDSLAAGLPWIFSPVLGLAMQPKWARACMKHFIGYSNPTSGNDRADSVISDFELVNYYAPSFLAAVHQGRVKSAMETYTSVNGEPVISSHKLLVELLRNDMGFHGVLVTDENEIHQLAAEHHAADSDVDAIFTVYNHTSVDMNMLPGLSDVANMTLSLVQQGQISEQRMDDSVRRILQMKASIGLLDQYNHGQFDWQDKDDVAVTDAVGSAADQRDAKAAADESIILLENSPKLPVDAVSPKFTLPIEDPQASVFVTGPLADSKAFLCGGWSIFWQGTDNSTLIPHGVSVRDALNHTFANVRYAEGVDTTGHVIGNRTADLALAASSTYTIVVVGESPYAEKNGDIDELALPDGQLEYVRALTAIHSTNVILVVVQGRPRLLQGAHKLAAAVLVSFLPCEQGGQAIADVISGRVNPSAKLPLTYPQASGNIHLPYFHRVNSECREGFQDCAMEWTFGAGLSYTSFEYSNVTLSDTKVRSNGTLTLDVTVTNTGLRAGKEVVFVFISQKVRHGAVPEVKLLKHFTKVSLQPQEATTVRFTLSAADWSYYRPQIGRGFHSVSEPGLFHAIVKHDTDCGRHPALCKAFHVDA